MAPDITFFLTVSLICNGPLKFLCLGSKIIQNYHFHFKCAMSCSKRILICSIHIINMREQLYFHHKGQLCSSMRLHDKIEQLPQYFECAQSSTWRFHDVSRVRKNVPNWESANDNSPLLLINQQEQRIWRMLLPEHFECAQSSSQRIQNENDNSNDFGALA